MTIADSSFMMEGGAISLSCSPDEEKRIIKELIERSEANLRHGNLYYVVSNRWFASWQRYVGMSDDEPSSSSEDEPLPGSFSRPGPIDNSDIICDADATQTSDLDLNAGLEEGRDYVLLPRDAWEKLHYWYKGGPPLPRKLISQGPLGKTFSVEVYPLRLNLIDSRTGNQFVLRFSKQASIRDLYESVSSRLGLQKEQIRIWDFFDKQKNSLLEVPDKFLQEANLEMDQDILIEVSENGSFPSEPGEISLENDLALRTDGPSTSSSTAGFTSLSSCQSKGVGSPNLGCVNPLSSRFKDMEDGHAIVTAKRKEEGSGLAGLQNLGNTCFMNSALQCLVHTPPIVEYFLQDYTGDINTKNPLGMHGELALAFGDLLRKLWASGRNAVAPRVFKGKLGRFAPQFSGYNQHDSQELLAFLLDGLHEDLNRVKQKPYIESKDYDGRPDKEVAEECWKNHKARNDSIIVDICQGQYKSTLVCPDCGKISITFDPFMYLSLPLPSTVTRTMTVTVFYGDGSGLPMPYTVTVAKAGSLRDLIQALTSACCLSDDERLLLAEVYGHKVYQYLENLITPLSNIKNEDRIVAYRLPKLSGLTRLEIIHQHHGNYVSDNLRSGERKLLGCPLVTYIEEDCFSGAGVDRCVARMLSPLKKSTFMAKSLCNKEDASLSAETNSGLDNLGIQSANQSRVDEKDDEMSSSDLTFHLYLVDSGGKISSPLNADTPIRPAQSIKVLLDWSEKEHEMYDATYIEHIPEVKAAVVVKKTKQEAISLSSCLEAFLKEEPLGPDDMWYCPKCKEHRQATKKLDLWRLPDILVFHLKRFSYTRYLKNKLDAFVNFPIHNLELDKYICDVSNQHNNVYELYAISNHYGGLGGGHYTAMVKLIEENKWYHFDDSHVSLIDEADIKTSAAYVLFYRRVKV